MKDKILGEGIAKQELNLVFIIDNSGSMDGEKIGAVNNAIRDVASILLLITNLFKDKIYNLFKSYIANKKVLNQIICVD